MIRWHPCFKVANASANDRKYTCTGQEEYIDILGTTAILRCKKLTDDKPIKLRKIPDPSHKATASNKPMPIAKVKAVDTEDNCCLLAIASNGLALLISSWPSVHDNIENGR